MTPPRPRHSAGSAPRPERHHRTAFVVSVRQLRPSASALPSAKRVHTVSAPRVSVRALERCHRRTRLASHRAEGRQWTTDGQPHASLLHNAAFCKVPGRSLASSLCGRAPLRALRVRKTGVMQSVCPGRRAPATKAGPLPRFLFASGARRVVCVRRSLVRRFAHRFVQRASPESWLLAPARPVARSLRSLRPRPGPSAPRGGSLQGAGVLPVAGVGGPLPGRRALRARRPGAPRDSISCLSE